MATFEQRVQQMYDVLAKCREVVARMAEEQIYGTMPYCDDPRDFQPDTETNTPAEIAAWEDACRRATAGEEVEIPRNYWLVCGTLEAAQERATQLMADGVAAASIHTKRPDGKIAIHVQPQTWGMGTSTMRDPAMLALLKEIDDALGGVPQAVVS